MVQITPPLLTQPIKQVKRARRLRQEMSLPEVLLWQELRKRPGGFRFRRQFPIAPLTVDFACLSARLAIEIDGGSHDRGNNPERDATRDRFVSEHGFRVLRIPAREVLKDLEACVKLIAEHGREGAPPPPSLCDGPPPRSGEDLL